MGIPQHIKEVDQCINHAITHFQSYRLGFNEESCFITMEADDNELSFDDMTITEECQRVIDVAVLATKEADNGNTIKKEEKTPSFLPRHQIIKMIPEKRWADCLQHKDTHANSSDPWPAGFTQNKNKIVFSKAFEAKTELAVLFLPKMQKLRKNHDANIFCEFAEDLIVFYCLAQLTQSIFRDFNTAYIYKQQQTECLAHLQERYVQTTQKHNPKHITVTYE